MGSTPEAVREELKRRGITPFNQRPSNDPDVRARLREQGILPQQPAGPGFMDYANAALQGLNRGAAETMPILGGIGGALLAPESLGSSIPLGIAAGYATKEAMLATMDVPTVDEIDPALRPFFVGGEVIGGGIVPSAGPLMATGRTGIRFVDRIVEAAQRNPKLYLTSEAVANLGAGTGAGLGEGVAPGNIGVQLLGGMAGGIAGSGVGIYAGGRLLEEGINRARAYLSTAGTENRASAELKRIFTEAGDDPAQVAKLLRELPMGDTRSAAQAVDSPALALLEAELGQRSPQFAREAAQQAQKSLEGMRSLIQQLAATGDPQALQEAARLRDDYFRGLLQSRLATAEARATEAAAQLGEASPAARAELGRRTQEILSNALDQARGAERQLWAQIPGSTRITPSALLAEATRIAKEDLLPNENLPGLARGFVTRIAKQPTNAREMLLFRSRMLDEARRLAAQDDLAGARIVGHLAEAALEDLAGLPGVDEARAFSRVLNDTFTRSFAGQALREDARGAARIPPEVLLRRATAGPAELTSLRLNELERAVRLGSPEAADELLGIQGRLISVMAGELRDPRTGLVTGPRLNRFISSNQEILQRFPEVREQLQSVNSANEFLEATQRSTTQAQRQIQREAAFTRIAGEENTVRAVDRILRGTSPQEQFRQLAITAIRDSDAAVEGFQSAVLQNAFERAGGSAGEFSFSGFRNALLEPIRAGQPSAMDLMLRNRIMDRETYGRLTRILNEADRVEQVIRTRPQLEHLLQNENALMDLALRVAGSKAGSAATHLGGGGSTGSTLIAASAGSRFARHIFNKIPAGRTQDVLIEAAKNPQIMAALLERAPTEQAKFTIARKLNAWLVGLGIIATEDQPQQQGQQ